MLIVGPEKVFPLFGMLPGLRKVNRHLSPGFPAGAVGRLDGVFGDLCYPGVTKRKELALTTGVTT